MRGLSAGLHLVRRASVRAARGIKLSAARSPGTRRKSALCLYTDVGSVIELARMSEGE